MDVQLGWRVAPEILLNFMGVTGSWGFGGLQLIFDIMAACFPGFLQLPPNWLAGRPPFLAPWLRGELGVLVLGFQSWVIPIA